MVGLQSRCRRSDSIVHRKIGTEAVLVPIRGNVTDLQCIYTLNEVGQRVWDLMDGEKTVDQLCQAIAAEFEVGVETAREDVMKFVQELIGVNAAEVR